MSAGVPVQLLSSDREGSGPYARRTASVGTLLGPEGPDAAACVSTRLRPASDPDPGPAARLFSDEPCGPVGGRTRIPVEPGSANCCAVQATDRFGARPYLEN